MVDFPEPEPGLVISYSYLWSREAAHGQVEGRKDRPCTIVVAVVDPHRRRKSPRVVVIPVTHRRPSDPNNAIEIPERVKQRLGLDGERSWIVVNEFNVFTWPGFDVRPIRRGESRIHYGYLPPMLFDEIIGKFRELRANARYQGTSRD